MGGFSALLTLLKGILSDMRSAPSAGIIECLLAGVFLLSGISKLRHPKATAMAIVNFGLGKHAYPVLGWLLGACEIGLGLMLLASGPLGLPAAAVLLWLFALLIVRSLSKGDRFACLCFGNTEETVSRRALLRTLTLALLTTIVASDKPGRAQFWSRERLLEVVVASSILGVVAVASQVWHLVRLSDSTMLELKGIGA